MCNVSLLVLHYYYYYLHTNVQIINQGEKIRLRFNFFLFPQVFFVSKVKDSHRILIKCNFGYEKYKKLQKQRNSL